MSNELAVSRQLTPDSWGMIQSVANAAYLSRKFGVTEGEAAIKMLFCYENSLPLTAANTGLYIVNGKIAAQSNVIAAQIRRHPDYDYRIKELTDQACTITILRRNGDSWEAIGESSFTMKDAQAAGLASSDTYQKYPRNMLFGRALTNAYRWYCPDVFSQPLYTPEELGSNDDNAIEAWATEIKPEPVSTPPAPRVPELSDLVATFGAEAVMAANGGQIPGTDAELFAVEEALNA